MSEGKGRPTYWKRCQSEVSPVIKQLGSSRHCLKNHCLSQTVFLLETV